MSEYFITNFYNDFEGNIDEDIYNNLIQSKRILFEARSKENIYNIVLMNYYEFEKELFEILLNDEIFESNYQIFNHYTSKIEQRILNLLASITLYLDSFEDERISTYVKNARQNNKKIKLMQFLRNHIQHNGLLVENLSLNSTNLSDELPEQTIKFHINKNKIKANGYKVCNFLDIEDDVDLKQFVREYMDFISNVHYQFREISNEKVEQSRAWFEEVLNKYSDYKYLYIVKKDNDVIADKIAILLDWDNIRVEMMKKNRVPTFFTKHSINTK